MDQYETDFSALEPEKAPAEMPATPATAETEVPAAEAVEAPVTEVVEAPVAETTEAPNRPVKVSPFADSPYVAYGHEAPAAPYTEAPAKQPWDKAPAKPAKKKKQGNTALSVIAIVLSICALIGTALGFAFRNNSENTTLKNQISSLQQQIKDLEKEIEKNSHAGSGDSISGTPSSPDGLTPGQVYARNRDSVVLVFATHTNGGTSSGSGFVLTEDGYVVTNYHVVEGASNYTIVTADGTEYTAALTGSDETNDVAVLKAEATGLDAVELGSSDDLIVGDQVVAIGNPLGELTSTLTVGYISAKDRDVSTDGSIINMLQTDAAINSGNSGGPLFNMKGQVIGITTAKYSGESSSGASIEGIGFAIPIDDVKELVSEIIENGYVSRPYIGVYIRDTAESIGVYVDSVEPGFSADLAGIKKGDIIVQLGSYEVSSIATLSKALNHFDVGDTTTITVYRNRKLLELPITFGERPQTDANTGSTEPTQPESTYPDWFDRFFGNGN